MRKTDKKTIQTYYNRSYVDEAQEFKQESLTNGQYEQMCDVNYLITTMNGAPRTPVYGEQSTWTFEDWQNEKARIKMRFNELTPEAKKRFGSVENFFRYCSDPHNFIKDTKEIGTQTEPIEEPPKIHDVGV